MSLDRSGNLEAQKHQGFWPAQKRPIAAIEDAVDFVECSDNLQAIQTVARGWVERKAWLGRLTPDVEAGAGCVICHVPVCHVGNVSTHCGVLTYH
jgi:hypothetical protein